MKKDIRTVLALLGCCALLAGLTGPSQAATKKKAPAPVAQAFEESAPAPSAQSVKSGLFVEGGLAGGAAALEIGYGRHLNNTLALSGALGYALGNKYGVVVIDLARLTYNAGGMFYGGAINYAMYSDIITSIPGISGNISNKNLAGLEVFAGKNFGRYSGRIAYSTALGLRAGVGYDL